MSIDDADAHRAALAHLAAGRLVAIPTETVYGLAGDAESDAAVAGIFVAKGRPAFNPLILHLGDAALAHRYATIDARAEAVMARFWPGPLTLVLPRRSDSPSSLLASAGLDTVALRQPAHPALRALLVRFGRAVAAPSANRSGRVSPTTASHVADEFQGTDAPALILDGGPCPIGLESTVLDLSGPTPRLLRPGAILPDDLRALLPDLDDRPAESAVRPTAPGQLASHYAPSLPVRLNATERWPNEAWLGFAAGSRTVDRDLSPGGDPTEAAARLFAALRRFDDPSRFTAIAVMPIPDHGLGTAINDRLSRAAAPRG